MTLYFTNNIQRAKKVVCGSPGLVDFAIGLVNFVLNLHDGLVKRNQFSSSKCFWNMLASACPNGKL